MPKKIVFLGVMIIISLLINGCDSYRSANHIQKIAELPNTPEFQIEGKFVDIGIAFNNGGINRKWVVFSGSTYWEMDKTELDEIAERAGIALPDEMKIHFWYTWWFYIISLVTGIVIATLWFILRPKMRTLKPYTTQLTFKNSSRLIFNEDYKIKCFNSDKVRWSSGIACAGSILVPSGSISIIFNATFTKYDNNKTQKLKCSEHKVDCIVEAGKTYYLRSTINYWNQFSKEISTQFVAIDNVPEKEMHLHTGLRN